MHANASDEINVFDLSMQRNREPCWVCSVPAFACATSINMRCATSLPIPCLKCRSTAQATSAPACWSNAAIGGIFRAWALVGAYDDNLAGVADWT